MQALETLLNKDEGERENLFSYKENLSFFEQSLFVLFHVLLIEVIIGKAI